MTSALPLPFLFTPPPHQAAAHCWSLRPGSEIMLWTTDVTTNQPHKQRTEETLTQTLKHTYIYLNVHINTKIYKIIQRKTHTYTATHVHEAGPQTLKDWTPTELDTLAFSRNDEWLSIFNVNYVIPLRRRRVFPISKKAANTILSMDRCGHHYRIYSCGKLRLTYTDRSFAWIILLTVP